MMRKGSNQMGSPAPEAPAITLPKGGGAIQAVDEKFSVNAVNGTAACTLPFPFSPSRNGFMPQMALSYNSGSGNDVFGLGWSARPPAITRKTEQQLPTYGDDQDIFILAGAEDLVPVYKKDDAGNWTPDAEVREGRSIVRYRPRIEGGFSRIEKITEANGNGYWKVTSGSNVVSVYGKSSTARIADPADPSKVFSWLLEFCYDDKGNCWQLGYKPEDGAGAPEDLYERNRVRGLTPGVNSYLKRVRYGNKVHFDRALIRWDDWDAFLNGIDYLLEVVLDYGEHDPIHPQPGDNGVWPCRTDAFSSYRAGFEIRTRRLCRRVLLFHRFAELGATPCLIRRMELTYEEGPAFTFLQSATYRGFIRQEDGSYTSKVLPPVTFTYSQLQWNTEVQTLPEESLDNLPVGIDGRVYQWIDLYSEGLSGILTEQAGTWYYKRNAGEGQFEPVVMVSSKPSLQGLATGDLRIEDPEARGETVAVSRSPQGFFEWKDEDGWQPFKAFAAMPNVDWRDPNLRMLDLNGDGMADILITEDEVFTWYPSMGKEGFDRHRTVLKAMDEEKGPTVVFAEPLASLFLADMSGDGLPDIVRVRNSDICYWPNLGYGRFGAKVNMSQAPVLDAPERFDARNVRLSDLDGSGTTDLVYVRADAFSVYFNQAGNSWSTENVVKGITTGGLRVIDLLGNGTGCVVWSTPLPGEADSRVRYIDLAGGVKPHLLTGYTNGMGSEVRWEYRPSTYYYLQDRSAGTPWVTKLPMVVHCVSRVIQLDAIRKTRFTNQYSYHHGYYDPAEREFRGFGRVDQVDTEDFDTGAGPTDTEDLGGGPDQPPVLTKSWFHTGAFIDRERVLDQFAHEYYQNEQMPEKRLDDRLPEGITAEGMTAEEWREALRACKGLPLRTEVYSPDGSVQQSYPYTTSQQSCRVELLQPRLSNRYAVFQVLPGEGLSYAYERNPGDPRVTHTLTLATDLFGHVLRSASVAYGRKVADPDLAVSEQAEQSRLQIIVTENVYTNRFDTETDHLLPVGFGSDTFELTGLVPAGDYFEVEEIVVEQVQQQLLSRVRAVFLKNDLSGPLAMGVIESLALPYQSYQLSLTPAMRDAIFGGKVTEELLTGEGGFVHLSDENYWTRGGTPVYDPANFYQVVQLTDVFGATSTMHYDTAYRWYVQRTVDAVQNTMEVVGFNFRTLLPWLVKDLNGNRSGARMDELGMMTTAFVMGKEGENKGDLLDVSRVETSAADRPGSVFEYDLFQYTDKGLPNVVKSTVYETHFYDLPEGTTAAAQVSYAYSDGGGGVILKKTQATAGRWIGNGRTIVNNKGLPVRQYEPYFSMSPAFEDAAALVEQGISSVTTYDALGRSVRVDMPNGTFARSSFDGWQQVSFDANDTVLDSKWYTDRITSPVAGVATPEEINAAGKAAMHAGTPRVQYLDSLGRVFLSVDDNGAEGRYRTTSILDITGNVLSVIDARAQTIVQHRYDLRGDSLYQNSPDTGERWTIQDVLGRPLRSWDSRGHVFRQEYDVLHRPVKKFVQEGTSPEICTEKTVYGEGAPRDQELNLRGRSYQQYDGAGLVTQLQADFKGNLLSGERRFLQEYRTTADWQVLTEKDLDAVVYGTAGSFDALNRPLQLQTPDGSKVRPVYDAAGALQELFVSVKGMAETVFVKNIDYDAKGQRQSIIYGNDTKTSYAYEPLTLRLSRLSTTAKDGSSLLQDLRYTYDPVGNITQTKDGAQPTLFFNNAVVEASTDHVYDAVYRLKTTSGREHIGQNQPPSQLDEARTRLPLPGDGAAMRRFVESYEYDAVGNILKMIHAAGAGNWTRTYAYGTAGNRLSATAVGEETETYTYDAHGNIQGLAHLPALGWDHRDALQTADLGGGGRAYYIYDPGGKRVRKVIERQDGSGEERLYLGACEVFRKIASTGVIQDQTETLPVLDDSRRIALVETVSIRDGVAVADGAWQPLVRYQYDNQLGSAALELDENAVILSYEEYYPFGATSYQAINAAITSAVKRYRYTGMERDEETGLEYHHARYYLPWLGRWLSADPIGIEGGLNLYVYCGNRPVNAVDPSGNFPWIIPIVVAYLLLGDDSPANAPGYKDAPSSDFVSPKEFKRIQADLDAIKRGSPKPLPSKPSPPPPPPKRVAVDTYPSHSDARMLGRGVVLMAAVATGGASTAVLGTGVAATTTTFALEGAVNSVGDRVVDDVDRGSVSSAKEYGVSALEGAATGVGAGYLNRMLFGAKIRNSSSAAEPEPAPNSSAVNETVALTPAEQQAQEAAQTALDRAKATQMSEGRGQVVSGRTITPATGDEVFVHTTGTHSFPEPAAANIVDTQSLRMSPGGNNGQWGPGAYAWEGRLESKAGVVNPYVEFRVPKGTAIDRIDIQGRAPVIRLVPPTGDVVPIVNVRHNLSREAIDFARMFIKQTGMFQ